MADRQLLLCPALCFLFNKYGKLSANYLRSVLGDFYSSEDLNVAKNRLLEDIVDLKTEATLPHVPRRRDSANRHGYKLDDIFNLIVFADEQKLFNRLPYVCDDVDCIPSLRLLDGDLKVFLSQRLSNIENSLGKLQVSSVDMAADISHLRRAVNEAQAKSQSTGRQPQLTDLNFPTLAQANVQAQAQVQTQASVQVHTSSQLPELPTRQPAVVAKSQQSSASQSWAGI
jgi:hypothetical protein